MALREELLQYLQEEEARKTQMGQLPSGQAGPPPGGYVQDIYGTQVPQSQKNVLWDMYASATWGFADEFLFGVPGYLTDWAMEKGYLPQRDESFLMQMSTLGYTPETIPGKVAGAIGRTAGFVGGAPMKLGIKGAQLVGKGVGKLGGRASSKTLIKAAEREALANVESVAAKELVEGGLISNRMRGIVSNAKVNPKHAGDDLFAEYTERELRDTLFKAADSGVISQREADIIANTYVKYFKERPVDDFIDIITRNMASGRHTDKGYAIGSMLHEATMFGMIDATREGVNVWGGYMTGEGHEYDWTAPIWGVATGASFGALKFMAPAGKTSVTSRDFRDGLKAYLSRNWTKGKTNDELFAHAKVLGDNLKRSGVNNVKYNGVNYDMTSMKSALATAGEKETSQILSGILEQERKKWGGQLMKWALHEDWASSKANWQKMVAGTILMNAHSFYDMSQGHHIPMEDVITNVLIGAFLNRKGHPRDRDMFPHDMNRIRSNLHILGIKPHNAFEYIPTLHPSRDSNINPLNNDLELRRVAEKFDELGLTTNNFDAVAIRKDPRDVTVAASRENLSLFREFKKWMQGVGKNDHVKIDDVISERDALEIQGMLQKIVGKEGRTEDLFRRLDAAIERGVNRYEGEIAYTAAELSKLHVFRNIDIGAPADKEMGTAPKIIRLSEKLVNDAQEGKLDWIRNDKGEVLSGDEALEVLFSTQRRAENIFGTLRDNYRIRYYEDPELNVLEIKDSNDAREIYEVLNAREQAINQSMDITKKGFEFSFENMDNAQTQLKIRRFGREVENISKKLKKGSKEWDDSISKLLIDMNLLRRAPDDATQFLLLGDGIAKVKITGLEPNDPRGQEARDLLGNVFEIVGSVNEYNRYSAVRDINVPIQKVDRLREALKRAGITTDAEALQDFGSEIARRIMEKHTSETNLDPGQIGYVLSQVGNPEKLFTFVPTGEGKPPGFNGQRIKYIGRNEELYQPIVDRYNENLKELEIAGARKDKRGLVTIIGEKVFTNPEDILGIEIHMEEAFARGNRTSTEQLVDVLRVIEGPDRLRDALAVYLGRYNQNATKVMGLLLKEGLIVRKFKDGAIKDVVEYELNVNKWQDSDVRAKIEARLERYGINKETIDQMYDNAQKAQELMITEEFGAGNKKVQTEIGFFNKWFPNKKGTNAATRDKLLDLAINDPSTNNLRTNAVEWLLKQMTYRPSEVGDAISESFQILTNRATRKKFDVLYYADQTIKSKPVQQSVADNPLMDFFARDMDIPVVFIDGTSSDWKMDARKGKMLHTVFNIFDKDATDLLPKEMTKFAQKRYDLFTEMLVQYQHGKKNSPGIEIVSIPGSDLHLGIPKEYHTAVTKKLKEIVLSYKDELTIPRENQRAAEKLENMIRRLEQATEWSPDHTLALHSLMMEKMLKGSQENLWLRAAGLEVGSKEYADLITRMPLWYTPNFTRISKDLLQSIDLDAIPKLKGNVKKALKHYADKGKLTVAVWNDVDNAKIRDRVQADLDKAKINWDELYGGREDPGGFDSISYISRRQARMWGMITGHYSDDPRIFKPVITSGGDNVLLLGKTVFVYSPEMQKHFFNRHDNVDIMMTASADKLGTMKPYYLEKSAGELATISKLDLQGKLNDIPLDAVGIKDVVTNKSPAKQSMSLWQNYMDTGNQMAALYATYYEGRINKSMDIAVSTVNDPLMEKALISEIKGLGKRGESHEDLFLKNEAAERQGIFLDWIDLSPYASSAPFGDNMMMNMLKGKFIEPSLAPFSYLEVGGAKYDFGGKSVLIQDPLAHRDLAPTLVNKDGQLIQYGQVMLPHHIRSMPIHVPNTPIKTKVVAVERHVFKYKKKDGTTEEVIVKKNEIINAEDWFKYQYGEEMGEAGWHSLIDKQFQTKDPMGHFVDQLAIESPKFEAIVTQSRFPRTRPNDLAILRIKGFLDKGYGNGMITNDLDVLNIFEGDYDYDKGDFFWMNHAKAIDHIVDSRRNWVHTVNLSDVEFTRPNLEMLSDNPGDAVKALDKFNANRRIMNSYGIGGIQSTVAQVNHLRNLAETRINKQTGQETYVLLELPDGSRVEVDWNNREWFMRHAFESQIILDHKKGFFKDLFTDVFSWKNEYLFPKNEDSYTREDFDAMTGIKDFIRKRDKGNVDKRIQIFRRYDKNNDPIDLEPVHQDMIRILMQDYNRILQLTPGRQVYSGGQARRHSYNDYMNRSNQYFNNMNNLSDFMFARLRSLRKKNEDGTDGPLKYDFTNKPFIDTIFKNAKQNTRVQAKKALKADANYVLNPETDQYYWASKNSADSPFSKGTFANGEARARGEEGSLIERSLNTIWKRDPLDMAKHERIVLSGEMYAKYELAERTLLEDQLADINDVMSILPKVVYDIKTTKSQIARLKSMAVRVLNNYKLSKKQKDYRLKGINEKIDEHIKKISPMVGEEYRKSRKAKDIGEIDVVDLGGDKEIINGTTQYYTLNNLGGLPLDMLVPRTDKVSFDKSITEVSIFLGKQYSDLNDFGNYKHLEKTLMDSESIERRSERKTAGEIEKDVESLITENVNKHGILWLLKFAAPKQKDITNKVGVFHGKPMPVAVKGTANYKRALSWLLKLRRGDIEGMEMYRGNAEITSLLKTWQRHHYLWQNVFHGKIKNLPTDEMDWVKIVNRSSSNTMTPNYNWELQSMFDNYNSFRFDRKIESNRPFSMGGRYGQLGEFFRVLYDVKGEGAKFDKYRNQMSYLHQLSMENGYMNPLKQAAIMDVMAKDLGDIINMTFPSRFDAASGTNKPINIFKLKENGLMRVLQMGDFNGAGVRFDPSVILSGKEKRSLDKILNQARDVLQTPVDNRFQDFFDKKDKELC